jgi:predicted amidohydrolase
MTVRVAACQVAVDIDDEEGTRHRLAAAIRQAGAAGAQLIVLPELAHSGYCFRDAAEAAQRAQPVSGEFVSWLAEQSAELDCVLVSGLCEAADGQNFNSAVVLDRGELRAVYRKVHLWGTEPKFFGAGSERPRVVSTSVGRIAPMICYDLEFPEWVRLAADDGAEIVAAPANWPAMPQPAGERPLEVIKAQGFAGTYRVFVVAADRCGPERGQDWVGGSVIIGADGYPLAGCLDAGHHHARSGVFLADLDPQLARDKAIGPYNDARRDRRPELYG